MRTKISLFLFTILIALCASQFILYKSGAAGFSSPYFFEKGYSPDAFEYQLPAANLALHGCFPYFGFLNSVGDYHICAHPDSSVYYRDIQKAGTCVFVSKPPLYSLVIGLAYRIFGFSPKTAELFNIWCLSLLVTFMPLTGFAVAGRRGLVAGVIAAIVFMCIKAPKIWNFDAEILTSFLVMLTYLVSAWAARRKNGWRLFCSGLCLSLLALCKGYFAIIGLFFSLYLLWSVYQSLTVRRVGALVCFGLGVAIPIVAWMMYINPLLKAGIPDRIAFGEKLKSMTPQVMLTTRNEGMDSTGKVRADVVEHLNKFHEYQQSLENGPITISNQLGKYNILNVHNEYCTDGDFHPEWMIIKTSFYNQYPNEDKNTRLWLFYTHNPVLGLKIVVAKLSAVLSLSGVLFYSGIFLSFLLLYLKKTSAMSWMATFFLITTLAIIVIFYGDIRFIQSIEPLTILFLSLCFLYFFRAPNSEPS